ncbi:MAG: hypothetical protein WBN96_04680 [Gammaproteobacteria bacterium]
MCYRNIKDYINLNEDQCDSAVGVYLLSLAVITAVLINISLLVGN